MFSGFTHHVINSYKLVPLVVTLGGRHTEYAYYFIGLL